MMLLLSAYSAFSRFLRLMGIIFCIVAAASVFSGCGPKKQEAWNSYYYGTYRADDAYPEDNDDTYVAPTQGAWNDNQTPQGQKWK